MKKFQNFNGMPSISGLDEKIKELLEYLKTSKDFIVFNINTVFIIPCKTVSFSLFILDNSDENIIMKFTSEFEKYKIYEGSYVAEHTIRAYVRDNPDKFIIDEPDKKQTKKCVKLNKNASQQFKRTYANDTLKDADAYKIFEKDCDKDIVDVFNTLPIENRNLLVFLFDHILEIIW